VGCSPNGRNINDGCGSTSPGLLQLTVPPREALGLPAWRSVLGSATLMLLQGLPLALLLFVFFPRLATPLWALPTDRSAKTGLSDRMAPGRISELSLSDAVAFRVRPGVPDRVSAAD